MNATRTIFRKIKNPVWVGVLVLIVAIIVIIFSSTVLYNRTVDLLTENLRERILTISITTASTINASDLAELHTENDWQKIEWTRVVNRLNRVKYANEDVVFMYIFRKIQNNPSEMEFIADADSINPYANIGTDPSKYVDVNRDGKIEPDGPDKLQWPGQPYPEAVDIPETWEAFNRPLTSQDIYTDDYGSVITGYAPIYDENGNTVAVLATDVKADDFFTITTQTLRPFLIFIVFLTLIISILTIIIIYVWRRHAKFLEKSNSQIKALASDLQVANTHLEELSTQKSQFVSLATHQIRSPLTALQGYASLLLEGDYGQVSKEQKEAITAMYESAHNLITIVGDYLDISRIDLGKMKYDMTEFSLRDLISSSVHDLQPNLLNKPITLTYTPKNPDDVCPIRADLGKIKQMVGNIIDNAIKYTPEGSIVVSLEHKTATRRYVVSIVDTGVGIAPETKDKLFERFSRADDAHVVNTQGTGLGLFIVKQFAEAHGGRIWVESEGKGKGSQFYIDLPERAEDVK